MQQQVNQEMTTPLPMTLNLLPSLKAQTFHSTSSPMTSNSHSLFMQTPNWYLQTPSTIRSHAELMHSSQLSKSQMKEEFVSTNSTAKLNCSQDSSDIQNSQMFSTHRRADCLLCPRDWKPRKSTSLNDIEPNLNSYSIYILNQLYSNFVIIKMKATIDNGAYSKMLLHLFKYHKSDCIGK